MKAAVVVSSALVVSILSSQVCSLFFEDAEDVCIGLDGPTPSIGGKATAGRPLEDTRDVSVDILLLIEASIYSVPYLAATLDGNFNDDTNGFMSQLKARLSDVRIAVSGYTNKPMPLAGPGPYGGWNQYAPSYCYQNFSPFTNDTIQVSEAFGHLIGTPVMVGQPSKITNSLRGNMFEGILNALNDPSLDWGGKSNPSSVSPPSSCEGGIPDSAPILRNRMPVVEKGPNVVAPSSSIHKSEVLLSPPSKAPLTANNVTAPSEPESTVSEEGPAPSSTKTALATPSIQPGNQSLSPLIHSRAQALLETSPAIERVLNTIDTDASSLASDDLSGEHPYLISAKGTSSLAQETSKAARLQSAVSKRHLNIIVVFFNVLSHTEEPTEEFAAADITGNEWSLLEYDAGESILKTMGGYPSWQWRRADPEIAHGMFDGNYRDYDNTASLGGFADLTKTMQHLGICFSGGPNSQDEPTECDEYHRDCMAFVDGIFNLTTPKSTKLCRPTYPSSTDVIPALQDDRNIHLAALVGNGQKDPFVYFDDCSILDSSATFAAQNCYPQWATTYLPNATVFAVPENTKDLTDSLTTLVLQTVATECSK